MIDNISDIEKGALADIANASDSALLAEVESKVLSKSAPLQKLRAKLGQMEPDERKSAGQAINESRTRVSEALEQKRKVIASAERQAQLELERVDMTEAIGSVAVGHSHVVTQATEELEDLFVGMGFKIAEGPEIESDWHNFDALNIPPSHPARDSFDSIYVDHGQPGSTLLRTHTSPVQIRTMLAEEPPIYIVAPGRVYRNDAADSTHLPVFHQIEALVIDEGISMADLAGTIETFTKSYFGEGFNSRLRPNHFPFTEPSAEFDIQRPDGSWLELGGCGMVHPKVLEAGGVDPERWSGFAFGFGIDRLASMKFGIKDIRDLFVNDMRFLSQF